MIISAVAGFCLLLGCVFFAAGTIGLLRFPDLNSRLHALAKADNLGLGFVVVGLIIFAGDAAVAVKLILIWALALLAAATSSHLLATRPDTAEATRPNETAGARPTPDPGGTGATGPTERAPGPGYEDTS